MDYLPTVILETTSTLLGEASVDIAMKFTQYPDPNSYRISFDWEDGWKKLCRFFPFMVILVERQQKTTQFQQRICSDPKRGQLSSIQTTDGVFDKHCFIYTT